jgi:hypothetical protein
MAKKLFRRIFRKPGAEPLERSYPAGELARAADQQPELFGQPSHLAMAPPSPPNEAEPAPERDLQAGSAGKLGFNKEDLRLPAQ